MYTGSCIFCVHVGVQENSWSFSKLWRLAGDRPAKKFWKREDFVFAGKSANFALRRGTYSNHITDCGSS